MKFRDAFHPYLFAIYAVIGIYQTNANDIPPDQVVRPIITLIAISALVNYLLFLYFKNPHRSALITSLLIFWGIDRNLLRVKEVMNTYENVSFFYIPKTDHVGSYPFTYKINMIMPLLNIFVHAQIVELYIVLLLFL